ncbi:uncharacterized protein LOC111248234 isoform X2 [Varroa destructor]|uniref:Osteopetrosis-associated transmembrane protein 1 n=1 Tax=Varroa destructor TaxID=109461 RepID=A0A7M7JR74_VARDE|nr:uncharacterized protein LOC111248234 isoform X2 [Varroa destructor]
MYQKSKFEVISAKICDPVFDARYDPLSLRFKRYYCSELLSDMATALKGFDCCALKNARPFTVCVNCAAVYQKAFDLFDRFVNGTAELSTNCSMLIDGGKISLVTESFQYIQKVWNEDGVCGGCYASGTDNVSSQIQEFFEKKKALQACVDALSPFENNQTCVQCKPLFTKLSNSFDKVLQSGTSKSVCVDVLDAMNETRREWGSMCFSSSYGMTPDVLIAMFTSLSTTFLFYLIVRLSQKPKDIGLARVSTWQSIKLEADCCNTDQVDAKQAAGCHAHQANPHRQAEHDTAIVNSQHSNNC